MPTYDYRCKSCGHEFEKFQNIAEEPVRKCPVCGKNSVIRLVGGGAGLLFRGSGFYITDYKKKTDKPEKGKSENKEKKASK